MVLELKPPQGTHFSMLLPLWHVFMCYVLSFVYLGIYWNNHHHLFQAVRTITGPVLWANLHLLFWLSLIPFTTAWMGENHFASYPVALYGVNLLLSACAYYLLTLTLLASHGKDSVIAIALGNDFKGKISVVIYLVAIGLIFWKPWITYCLYIFVAIIWLVPDRRIEKALASNRAA